MHTEFTQRLQEVRKHFEANDRDLALRRLLDCALETQNLVIFRETLSYLEGSEAPGAANDGSQTFALLEKIEQAGIAERSLKQPLLINAENISKRYVKGNFQLSNVSLQLNAGEIIGLVGENGNGKTTLLRLLAGSLKPDEGTIDFSFSYNQQQLYKLKTEIAYIEQRIPKWYGGLMDNLQFSLANYGVKGEANLLWAEMMVARLGLRPYKEMTWARLSSGYRTRFELARILLCQPKVLLLDEPLANLDILAQQTVLQDLKYMSASITSPFGMVLSSQHIYEVEKVSDKIIFLKQGAPQYQYAIAETEKVAQPLIIELETIWQREELATAFATSGLEKVLYNGGVFTLYFNEQTSQTDVLDVLASQKINVTYFRDITHSSRRFFNN